MNIVCMIDAEDSGAVLKVRPHPDFPDEWIMISFHDNEEHSQPVEISLSRKMANELKEAIEVVKSVQIKNAQNR